MLRHSVAKRLGADYQGYALEARREHLLQKRRNEPYRTYSLTDAFNKAERLLPASLGLRALRMNVDLLSTYRDNAVHFYNAPQFGSVIYALAQTSVVNLRDILDSVFGMQLAAEITWHLLPLGLDAPIDPIEYISGKAPAPRQSSAVRQFLAQVAASTQELESHSLDTSRLLTVFKVKLESTKKIGNADVVVGIQAVADNNGPLVISKTVDPNQTHPLRMTELIAAVGELHKVTFGSGIFQAVAWKYGMKSNPTFCWKSTVGQLVRYSYEAVTFIKRLTPGDIALAQKEYRERNRKGVRSDR